MGGMTHRIAPEVNLRLYSRAELTGRGFTAAGLTEAVRSGQLIRVRRGLYAMKDTHLPLVRAARIGGRLACVAALAASGVWVHDSRAVHLQLDREKSRLRSPRERFTPLSRDNREQCELHWRPLNDPDTASEHVVGPVDAMLDAVRCQEPWFAIASLDSALRSGYLQGHQLDAVFFHLPRRHQYLRALIDARCESGLETIFRLLMRDAGIAVELQVSVAGVGRVDFVVAGCIVVETDGAEFHGAATAERDYDRDLRLAELGYVVIRLNYRQIMYEQPRILAAIRALAARTATR